MENIGKAIELLQKGKEIHETKVLGIKRKQITEYNNLMQKLQNMKDKRKENVETLNKNVESLIMHKHSILKHIHNSEQVPGLPISHDYHQQTRTFFFNIIDFINKSQNVYKNVNNSSEDNVNSKNLIDDIMSCTNSVANELHIIESEIATVKALQRNTEVGILFNSNNESQQFEK